ncbi:SGNH/GDSL hydrolase family protein [Patulibacter minatonensis]|uniref:SGNH/GDSL hydrolase family protein n=1 Tax=Patulibacter minatonensis TaxID=298163 RepID=UPI00047E8308|nr:SGNH/GDSL hydrolase family protein [Patulibacter minatonensis]
MSPASRPRPLLRGALAILVALAGGTALAAPAGAAEGRTYVAFGDSYTSGLGMADQRPAHAGEPAACTRSAQNYPAQVAKKLDLGAERTGDWADLSCANATLSGPALLSPVDLLGEVALAEKAGVLGDRTRFVTFTAGGNDRWDSGGLGLFAGAILCLDNPSCGANPPADQYQRPGSVTAAAYVTRAKPALDRIRALAPKARIALVEYAQVLPSTDPICRTDQLVTTPAAAGSNAYARAATNALFGAQPAAAQALGIGFVDTTKATAGHDICQEAGTRWFARTGDSGADPVHPTLAAHTAVAKAVYAARPSLPKATLKGPASARVGRTATFRATNLVRAPGYRARVTRQLSVAGRTRTCSAPVGSRRTATGTASFKGRIPSRLTCARAPRASRTRATPAGRYTVRVCAESSSGACRSTGSTVQRTVRLSR